MPSIIGQRAEFQQGASDGTTVLHIVIGVDKQSPPSQWMVALLLQHWPSLGQGDGSGMTSLMYSTRCAHLRLNMVLLARGANVHVSEQDSRTTLHHAVLGKDPDVVALPVSKGMEVDARTRYGKTALYLACNGSSLPFATTARVLLDAGTDKDALDGEPDARKTPATPGC